MPATLADYFFIAGLEGTESDILDPSRPPPPSRDITQPPEQHPRPSSSSSSSGDGPSRDVVPSIREAIVEEPSSSRPSIAIDSPPLSATKFTSLESPNYRPATSSTLDSRLSHLAAITHVSDRPFLDSHPEPSSDHSFEHEIAKFVYERDNFVLALSPPTLPTPTRTSSLFRRSVFLEHGLDHGGGHVSESGASHMEARALRPRSYLRSKIADLSRRASSRTANGARAISRSSRRSSVYNAVTPVPEPLVLPPGTHPLKRKVAPRLLGIWPTSSMTEEIEGRGTAPDYLPMFAFPNDIQVKLSDERPRSTWHGFTMTKANGDKVHVCSITMWHPVPPHMAQDLERQCRHWRQENLSLEERQLAESLTNKLANERSQLSSLLSLLPSLTGHDREQLDEQILLAEEKIALYNELLKPIRTHAAARVDGLTDGQGMWLPRAFGLLGRETGCQEVWREWLRAVVVPYLAGEVDVPGINEKGDRFLPLERYIVNMCGEVPLPLQGRSQVEISVRELRLYAAKEGFNEIPNWRDVDLYPLFRSLSLKNIITLYEAILVESRIILRSSHASLLNSAATALTHLLYPLKFSGVYIPVLPCRLLSCLDAPVSYIIGIDRAYQRLELPVDDFLLCDLDQDSIMHSSMPMRLPPTVRQKLGNLLAIAAPLHLLRGVPTGPPLYMKESFPRNCFTISRNVISKHRAPAEYGKYIGRHTAQFGDYSLDPPVEPPVFNAFAHVVRAEEKEMEAFFYASNPNSIQSFTTTAFDPSKYSTVSSTRSSQSGSGNTLKGLTAHLRHPSSGSGVLFNRLSDRSVTSVSPSPLFTRKGFSDTSSVNGYAVSISQGSLAQSSIMNFDALAFPPQNVEESDKHQWREGHSMRWRERQGPDDCAVCFETSAEPVFVCDDCHLIVHHRCLDCVILPCPSPVNFSPTRIRAAFLRCMTTLLVNYRKFLEPISSTQRTSTDGQLYSFNLSAFVRSAPRDSIPFMEMLSETQAFSEFIMERCDKPADDPAIAYFDQMIMAKRNRGRRGLFAKQGLVSFSPAFFPTSFPPPHLLSCCVDLEGTPMLSPLPITLDTRKAVPPNDARLPPTWELPDVPPSKIDPRILLPPRLAQPRHKFSREKGFAKRKPVNRSDDTIIFPPPQEH